MPDSFYIPPEDFVDIKSVSRKGAAKNALGNVKMAADNYGNGVFKNMANIIKVIAFMVSMFVFLIFAAASVIIYIMDSLFLAVAIAVLIFGIICSVITLFLIYGLGHMIAQNNEILKRLR